MFSNNRVLALIVGCIVALLILAGCQPGNSAPETTEETISVPEEIRDTVVEVKTVESAQPTVEQQKIEQTPTEQEQPTATMKIVEQSPSEQVVEQPTEVATASPTDSPEPVTTYLGDVVEVEGYLISATNIYAPAELENYNQPEEGEKLVAIDAIIGVTTGKQTLVFREFSLVDKEGFTYTCETPRNVDIELNVALISPGEKMRFFVVFKIPTNAIPTILTYRINDQNKVLAVGLGAPPEDHKSNSEILNVPPVEPVSKLGDISIKFGYSISAQGVKDPAEPNKFRTINSGEKLVEVDVIIENESAGVKFISPWKFYLIDNLGYLYPSEVWIVDDEIHGGDLSPGEKVRGWVAFSIPEEASPYILKYGPGAWVPEYYVQTGLIE